MTMTEQPYEELHAAFYEARDAATPAPTTEDRPWGQGIRDPKGTGKAIADAALDAARLTTPEAAPEEGQTRLFAAVRRVIRDGYDSPGTYEELHAAFYEARDAATPAPTTEEPER